MGANWGWDGNIIAGWGSVLPLSRIPAGGGPWQPFTKLGLGEITHRWPQALPDGGAVLFTASPSTNGFDNANVEAISLKTGQVKIVLRGGSYGRYLPSLTKTSGHLVYVYQGVLFGVAFDPLRLEVSARACAAIARCGGQRGYWRRPVRFLEHRDLGVRGGQECRPGLAGGLDG